MLRQGANRATNPNTAAALHCRSNACACVDRRSVRARSHLGPQSEAVLATIQVIGQAIQHSTCAPFSDLADEETLVINPPWINDAHVMGISHASCGITTQTAYSDEQVTPIAAASDAGSTFLLWEREAHYNGSRDAKPHAEKICGVSYMKKDDAGRATVIATFRQPSQEELLEHFRKDHELIVRPGAFNFFEGCAIPAATRSNSNNNTSKPSVTDTMVSAAREYYAAWDLATVEQKLEGIADARMRVREPMWESEGAWLPVNRVETALWMERMIKNSKAGIDFEAKSVVACEGSNMVFALWFAKGLDDQPIAGVHIFFFTDELTIRSIASFREPTRSERRRCLRPSEQSRAAAR